MLPGWDGEGEASGFGIGRWGQPRCPLERRLWDMRVWGSAEGGEERGKGQGRTCQRCLREGSRHQDTSWDWDCSPLPVPGRPWHPSCTAISACKEKHPPGRATAPTRCAQDVGLPLAVRICGHQRGCVGASGWDTRSLLAWDYHGYGVVLLGPRWWYPVCVGLASCSGTVCCQHGTWHLPGPE